MPMSINGSFNSLPAISDLQLKKKSAQIASGQRINSAADDPAGLAIATRFSTQVGGLSVAMRNAGDGISFSQVASGGLGQASENLQRIRELSLQAANGTLSDTDRGALQKEVDQLKSATQDILGKTNFNGVPVYTSTSDQVFQVGENAGDTISVPGKDLQKALDDLGLNDIDISSQKGATEALATIDKSLETIVARDAEYGAVANRFEATIRQSEGERVNAAEARSRIADTDIAEAAAGLISEQIRNQAQISVRAQANSQAQQVLRLLGG